MLNFVCLKTISKFYSSVAEPEPHHLAQPELQQDADSAPTTPVPKLI
jgi:hypothetical protein